MNIFDVASYIIDKKPGLTTKHLQKLCYYSQGWYLAWEDKPLFEEEFEAWKEGPVSRDLFLLHRRKRSVTPHVKEKIESKKELSKIKNNDIIETINFVIDRFGEIDPDELGEITHQEEPWLTARGEFREGDYCDEIITKESILEFYKNQEDEMLLEIVDKREAQLGTDKKLYSMEDVFG